MAAWEVLYWLRLRSPVLKGSGWQNVLSKLERSLAVGTPLGCGLIVLRRLLCLISASWRMWVICTSLVFGLDFFICFFLQFLGSERGSVSARCFVHWTLVTISTLNPSVVFLSREGVFRIIQLWFACIYAANHNASLGSFLLIAVQCFENSSPVNHCLAGTWRTAGSSWKLSTLSHPADLGHIAEQWWSLVLRTSESFCHILDKLFILVLG